MASILRCGSVLRISSGFKHGLASSYCRCEAVRIQQKLHIPSVNLSIIRSISGKSNVKKLAKLNKCLYDIDEEISRTARISQKNIDEVFRQLRHRKYCTTIQSLHLIRCCGSLVSEDLPEVRNKRVQEIWDIFIKLGIRLDINHYNALLKVYLENEHKFSPTEFLSMLEKNGVEPNRATYQRLIFRFCHEGDMVGASKILEFMKEDGFALTEEVFNALVIGHAHANDLESAHGVLGVMQRAGLKPSQQTYMMLMVGYAEKGDIDGLNRVLEECETANIQLRNTQYVEVIVALAAKGHTQHVPQIYNKYLANSDDPLVLTNIIKVVEKSGKEELLTQLLETLDTRPNTMANTKAKTAIYSKWLEVLCNNEKYEEALSVLEESLITISLENFGPTLLSRLKDGLALSNKTFPYTIHKKIRRD